MIWLIFGLGYCNDDIYVLWMIIIVLILDFVFIKVMNFEVKKFIYRSRILCYIL